MSSASETISSQLSQTSFDSRDCSLYIMRFFFWSCMILLIISCISSIMSTNAAANELDTLGYRHPMMRGIRCKCGKNKCNCMSLLENYENVGQENYENLEYISYSNSDVFNVQSVPLTAPLEEETGEYSNMTFGQAYRHIIMNNREQKVMYNISANLYVLDGNIYDQAQDNLKQAYIVQLRHDNGNIIKLGELKKDSDGMYKLKVESNNIKEYTQYKHIEIVYYKGDNSQVMIHGKFK